MGRNTRATLGGRDRRRLALVTSPSAFLISRYALASASSSRETTPTSLSFEPKPLLGCWQQSGFDLLRQVFRSARPSPCWHCSIHCHRSARCPAGSRSGSRRPRRCSSQRRRPGPWRPRKVRCRGPHACCPCSRRSGARSHFRSRRVELSLATRWRCCCRGCPSECRRTPTPPGGQASAPTPKRAAKACPRT